MKSPSVANDVDIIHDLNKGIPYKNDTVDEIKATILVPHFLNPLCYHFLHKNHWSYNSLNFLEKWKERCYYAKTKFKILKRYQPSITIPIFITNKEDSRLLCG